MKIRVNKEMVYNMVLEEVMKLNLKDGYNAIFLATMVLRKIRHPEENMREIALKVMKTMPVRYGREDLSAEDPQEELMKKLSRKAINKSEEEYGKNDIVVVSIDKCLDQLEMALNDANLPEEWLSEQIVGTTVKKLAARVIEKINKLVD